MMARAGMTTADLAILVAVVALIAAIGIPAARGNRQRSHAARCAMNLDILAAAAQRFVADHGQTPGAAKELVPAYLETLPHCPAGGTYALGTDGQPPTCTIPGHHF